MKSLSAPIIAVLVFTISIMSSSHLSGDVVGPLEDETYKKLSEEISRVTDIVREGQTNIDRSAFDLEANLDRLDYDADNIVGFARRSIAFEQYPGLLRGPTGTLLSLAGNTLDQSLLLGKLLRDAGYEARIARTTLDDESARVLLRQMNYPATSSDSGQINEKLAASLTKLIGEQITPAELLEQMESAAKPKNDPAYHKVEETTRFLQETLADAGIEPASKEDPKALIAEASDYFWVQYKGLAAEGWIDAHPAFVDDPPETMPAPVNFYTDAVPDDLQHRIRLQFFIERSTSGKLEAIPISAAWERPAANLVDTPVSFTVTPIGISNDTLLGQSVTDAIDSTTIFATIFNGSVMPGGEFFDLKGNTIDPMAMSNAAAGVFAAVGDRFGSAAKAMGADVPTLTAHWVQITLIAPDGSERTFRRTTLDQIGAAARAENKAPDNLTAPTSVDALNLLRKHTIMISNGRTPVSLTVDRSFEWMLRAEPMYRQLREQVAFRAHDKNNVPKLKPVEDLPTYWPGHLSLVSVFDRANSLVDSHRIYRASPGVIIHVQGQLSADTAFEMIDIVTNARRAVAINNDIPSLDPQAAMVAGVWDTAKEGALLKPGDTRIDTESVFTHAMAQGKPLVTLHPGKPISGVTLSPDIKALVEADLSRGFAVVLPDNQNLMESAAWWRVNPETGETVGQAMDGRGSVAETLAVFATAVTTISLLYGLDSCHRAYQRCHSLRRPIAECSDEYFCCNGMSFLATTVGLFSFASKALSSMTFDAATSNVSAICD